MPALPRQVSASLSLRSVQATPKIWNGSLQTTGIDLIAMVVSDSGLASDEPEWWNASVWGCVLIGLQPRGGWQVLQRTVQWGDDSLTKIFGVSCSKPALYAYFACSMRNRMEVWNSDAWTSPTEGSSQGEWKPVGDARLKRPTKLIDGSRGGQGFICDILCPRPGDSYTIAEQAKMQLLSVIFVIAGLMHKQDAANVKRTLYNDFEVSDRLGVIFSGLTLTLLVFQALTVCLSVTLVYAIFVHNLFLKAAPFLIQFCSVVSWACGAIALLMLGGNPRVRIANKKLPDHIRDRIEERSSSSTKEGYVRIEFGTIHGTVFDACRGHCLLPIETVRAISAWDLELKRPMTWKLGFIWHGSFLVLSIFLQIAGAQVTTVYSEALAVVILLITALARGWGVSGPEEWLIPKRRMRRGAKYGASLLGRMVSRQK